MRIAAAVLLILGMTVALAWVVEAFTVGRGFISTHLAPLAFVSIGVSSVLTLISARARKK